MLFKRLLQGIERAVLSKPFDRDDLALVGLHREHQAGAHRLAVKLHRATAAHAMLAANVRPGQGQFMAQKISETDSRLDFLLDRLAIDQQLYFLQCHFSVPIRQKFLLLE